MSARTWFGSKRVWPALLAIALLTVAVVSEAGLQTAAADELPPTIAKGSIKPGGQLPPEAGYVVVEAEVSDPDGVGSAGIEVVGSGGPVATAPMNALGAGIYRGKARVPANSGESAVVYQVSVKASDTVGNSGSQLIGEVTVSGEPTAFDLAPVVSELSASPKLLPASGGTETVELTATDDHGVASAGAVISLPAGGFEEISLEAIGGDRYRGTYPVPANASEALVAYAVQGFALDAKGHRTGASAGSFEVIGTKGDPACVRANFEVGETRSLIDPEAVLWPRMHQREVCPGARVRTGTQEFLVPSPGAQMFATDLPPSLAEITEARAGKPWHVVTIPVAQTSIAIVANPPGGCPVKRITNRQLDEVFRGTLGRWSEILTAPEAAACDQPIRRIVPGAGASGMTVRFKQYLARLDNGPLPCIGWNWSELLDARRGAIGAPLGIWPEGCPEVSTPVVRVGANETANIAAGSPGAIGFAPLSQAIKHAGSILQLENDGQHLVETREAAASAHYAAPGINDEAANCGGTTYPVPLGAQPGQKQVDVDWSKVSGANPKVGGTFYPLCMLSYMVGYREAHRLFYNRERVEGAIDYLRLSVFSPSGQALLEQNLAMPVPTAAERWRSVLVARENAMAKLSF
jgi:ABC-type phosphate transport system substrate-binding protein